MTSEGEVILRSPGQAQPGLSPGQLWEETLTTTPVPPAAEEVKGLTFPALLPPLAFCMNLQAGDLPRLKQRKGGSV